MKHMMMLIVVLMIAAGGTQWAVVGTAALARNQSAQLTWITFTGENNSKWWLEATRGDPSLDPMRKQIWICSSLIRLEQHEEVQKELDILRSMDNGSYKIHRDSPTIAFSFLGTFNEAAAEAWWAELAEHPNAIHARQLYAWHLYRDRKEMHKIVQMMEHCTRGERPVMSDYCLLALAQEDLGMQEEALATANMGLLLFPFGYPAPAEIVQMRELVERLSDDQ